jgi:beta-lactamase regulating signal transducer with metallopeptidase domain
MNGDTTSASVWLLLLVQSTACIATGLLASYLLRDRPARAHQALLTALLASVLMPSLYLLVQRFHLGVLRVAAAAQPQESPEIPTFAAVPPVEEATAEFEDEAVLPPAAGVPAGRDVAEPERQNARTQERGNRGRASLLARGYFHLRVFLPSYLRLCWAAAVAVLLGRLAVRFVLGLHLLYTARPLRDERLDEALATARDRLGVRRHVRIRCSAKLRSPIIWCWARAPVLLVHAGAEERPRQADWVGIFCHELAHLRRRDHLSGLLAEVLTALLPWQPLLWWARDRLARLSEQACDDWALAGGRIGVDYAEALLALVPQRPTALLPTVVGKEKAMKERIRRIVRDRGGNPRIGLRWAAAVSILAVLTVVGVAVAQRRPVERERPEREGRPEFQEPTAGPRPALAGRRNVLLRLRDQLRDQARDTENALRERGDDQGPDTRVLRAELETLHEQLEHVERQLRELEQEPRAPGRMAVEPPAGEQMNLRAERLRDLKAGAAEIERNLREHPDMEPDRADALREEQRRIHEQIRATEGELRELNRRREAGERRPPAARRPEVGAAELERQRAILAAAIRANEQQLREREARGETEGPEVNALRENLEGMRNQMAALEARSRGEGSPAGEQERRLQAEVNELRDQMSGLQEQMQQMQRTLEQLVQQRATERRTPAR